MHVCTSLQTDYHASNPPLSFFTGRMPFLPPNQQRQSTEGNLQDVYTIADSVADTVAQNTPWLVACDGGTHSIELALSMKARKSSPRPSKKNSFIVRR